MEEIRVVEFTQNRSFPVMEKARVASFGVTKEENDSTPLRGIQEFNIDYRKHREDIPPIISFLDSIEKKRIVLLNKMDFQESVFYTSLVTGLPIKVLGKYEYEPYCLSSMFKKLYREEFKKNAIECMMSHIGMRPSRENTVNIYEVFTFCKSKMNLTQAS